MKIRFTAAVAVLVSFALMFIISCGSPTMDRSEGSQSKGTKTEPICGKISKKTLLESLIKGTVNSGGELEWKLPAELKSSFNGQSKEDVFTGIIKLDSFNTKRGWRLYAFTQTSPGEFDCHSCEPLVGIGVFKKANGCWQVIGHQFLTNMGSFGLAPEPQLVNIGPDRIGFIFEPGFSGQGVTESSLLIYGETRDDFFSEVVNIAEANGDNSGFCDPTDTAMHCQLYHYETKYKFNQGSNPDYFDFEYSTTGTKDLENDNSGAVRPVSDSKKLTYSGGKFK